MGSELGKGFALLRMDGELVWGTAIFPFNKVLYTSRMFFVHYMTVQDVTEVGYSSGMLLAKTHY